jgi:beta-mannosidase
VTTSEARAIRGDRELAGPWRAVQLDAASGLTAQDAAHQPGAAWLDATVPGAIQYDLVRAGRLGNPFAGTAAATDAHWVSDTDWVYRTTIDLDAADASARWAIELDGVDTFADVWLNGTLVGSTANAYRAYRFELGSAELHPGENEVVVHVKGHGSMIADKVPEARRLLGHTDPVEGKLGKSLIRRYQRSFYTGSSLLNVGTGVLGIGIHRPVRLLALPAVEITDVFVATTALSDTSASLRSTITLDPRDGTGPFDVEVTLLDPTEPGVVVASARTSVTGSGSPAQVTLELDVPDPRPWWPRGYGEPTLYPLRVTVADPLRVTVADGPAVLDTVEQHVGIRTAELLEAKPSGRPTFELVVNGVRLHVRGTNYIPVDYLKVHGEPADYTRVFALFENGNNNLVRMWGGGAIESEEFYDECDRRGLMIWQDFYLHSNVYPDYDPEFVAEFAAESRELLIQMRRHPSLVLLCGGNEQREGWDEYGWRDTLDRFYGESLVTRTIPALLDELPTGVPYIDNSPHGGTWSQSPVRGESHIWGNFFNSTKDPLFVTETCWGQDSYSRPETLKEVMGLDVDELTGLGWPARWTELTSLPVLGRFPYTGYHPAGSLRAYLRGLEIEQAEADRHALTNFRLRSSSNRGIVYWSFNKGGPLFQFGAIDYRLRPLMSHYVVARLYRDIVVGAYRDIDDIRVVASNLTLAAVDAELDVVHLDTDGAVLRQWHTTVQIPADTELRLLDLRGHYQEVVDRNREVVFSRLSIGGVPVSDDLLLLCPLGELDTPRSGLTTSVRRLHDGEWELTVGTEGVSKMVQIEGTDGLILDDNYFPLVTGHPRTIVIRALEARGDQPITLNVSSLDDDETQDVLLP